jgi:hypothetical protein
VAIIYGTHYLVGGSDPAQNSQHMIPWLEVILAGTVCAAFIKDEVLDIATFFRVSDRKKGGFSKGNVAVVPVGPREVSPESPWGGTDRYRVSLSILRAGKDRRGQAITQLKGLRPAMYTSGSEGWSTTFGRNSSTETVPWDVYSRA